jgi:hypothetical protein
MTAEEYWDGPGIRFLNEDGTLPTVEERVKEGYCVGWDNGWNVAWDTRDEHRDKMFAEAGFLRMDVARLREKVERQAERIRYLEGATNHACGTPLSRQKKEVERLRKLLREYINFMDENLGTTADWPMEAAFDDGDVCQRHCDLLNAMKREVKPEDIN